jgi:hypothetical protein
MVLIYIVGLIAWVTIVGGLVWFAQNNRQLNCTSNGCTGDCNQGRDCDCIAQQKLRLANTANWPFPKSKP